jgi:histidine triad (HIT) family protein
LSVCITFLSKRKIDMSEPTIFEKIIDRDIPAKIVFEDDLCLAFEDINPQAPTHLLLISKKPIPSMAEIAPEDEPLIGHMIGVIARLASELGLDGPGYRVVNNCGAGAGQEVMHLHFHILSGRKFSWPPG